MKMPGIITALAAFFLTLIPLHAAVTFSVSPSSVSNTYNGIITFQISGLTNAGDTVILQKFLDLNTNGVVDPGEMLMQQFVLTDGHGSPMIGSLTNVNVPGDINPANNVITAQINFQNGDWIQKTVGNYLFVLSSPTNNLALTNSFKVTNSPYPQSITGQVTVTNGSSSTATNPVVIVFGPPKPGHGLSTPLASLVADSSGHYSIPLPVGGYSMLPAKPGYVSSFSPLPTATLSAGQNSNVNLTLAVTTSSISGRLVDSVSNSVGLPAGLLTANNNGYLSFGFASSNGNFNIAVNSGSWSFGGVDGLPALGYSQYDQGTNANAGTTGFQAVFSKATAAFYGTVKDNLGNPIPGVFIAASDSGTYYTDGFTDANGYYIAGAVGGIAGDNWSPQVDNSSTNYIFTQNVIQQSGGVTLSVGESVQANFTGVLATNFITGRVVNASNSPIVGVGVNAQATINGLTYYAGTSDTDSNGYYSLQVSGGNWGVSLNCGCTNCSDNLSNIYLCPNTFFTNISTSNGVVNFTVQSCNGVQIGTTSLPSGTNGDFYTQQFSASSCDGNFTWSVIDPQHVPSGLTLYSGGSFNGTPNTNGTFNFTVHVMDGNGQTANQPISLYIAPAVTPLQIVTYFLPNGTNGVHYSQTLHATGGQPPYNWLLAAGSANLPNGLSLSTNGLLSGLPTQNVTNYQFIVALTDTTSSPLYQILSLTIYGAANNALIPLTSPHRLGNGQFQFTYSGLAGVNYTIQSSTNLINWSNVITLSGSGSAQSVGLGTSTNVHEMFYRLKVGP